MCKKSHTIYQESCRSCRLLKNTWYTKLKEETDFEDIEKGEWFTDHKSTFDFSRLKGAQTPETYSSQVNYYQWARSKATEAAENSWFRSQTDRIIWEGHSEGKPRREIAIHANLENSYITRKIERIKKSFLDGSISSITFQLSLF